MSSLRAVSNISVLATIVDGADAKSLRGVADQVRSKMLRQVCFYLLRWRARKRPLLRV